MTLLATESFALSANVGDFLVGGNLSSNSTSGSCSLSSGTAGTLGDPYISVYNAFIGKNLPASNTVIFGRRMQPTGPAGTNSCEVDFYDTTGGTVQCCVVMSATGNMTFFRGSTIGGTGTSIANFTGVVPNPLGWHYIEIQVTFSTTAGIMTVRCDGTQIATASGLNNQAASGNTCSVVGVLGSGSGWQEATTHWYVSNTAGAAPWNTYLGDCRVKAAFPTAAGATTAFTPSTGTNYSNVDRVPPSPGTYYNSSATVGAVDTFAINPALAGALTVYGVSVKSLVAKSDSGARSMANKLKSGTTLATGAGLALGTSFGYTVDCFQTDPNTSAAWTLSAVNSAQPGYTVSA